MLHHNEREIRHVTNRNQHRSSVRMNMHPQTASIGYDYQANMNGKTFKKLSFSLSILICFEKRVYSCGVSFDSDLKDKREQSGYCFGVLIVLSYFLVIITFPLSLCFCLKVCFTVCTQTSLDFGNTCLGCTRIRTSCYFPSWPYLRQRCTR